MNLPTVMRSRCAPFRAAVNTPVVTREPSIPCTWPSNAAGVSKAVLWFCSVAVVDIDLVLRVDGDAECAKYSLAKSRSRLVNLGTKCGSARFARACFYFIGLQDTTVDGPH